jgi:hypothetical protein
MLKPPVLKLAPAFHSTYSVPKTLLNRRKGAAEFKEYSISSVALLPAHIEGVWQKFAFYGKSSSILRIEL